MQFLVVVCGFEVARNCSWAAVQWLERMVPRPLVNLAPRTWNFAEECLITWVSDSGASGTDDTWSGRTRFRSEITIKEPRVAHFTFLRVKIRLQGREKLARATMTVPL